MRHPPDEGHILRLELERETLRRCKDCNDKPPVELLPDWETVKEDTKKLAKATGEYCQKNLGTCVAIAATVVVVIVVPVPVPIPVP